MNIFPSCSNPLDSHAVRLEVSVRVLAHCCILLAVSSFGLLSLSISFMYALPIKDPNTNTPPLHTSMSPQGNNKKLATMVKALRVAH